MAVLSIQSSVARGHVGNSAAAFALQRMGVEVWPVHSVQLSGHTGREGWGGGALGVDHVRAVLEGIERQTRFAGVDAVLTGYLGSAELAAVAAEAVDKVKAARPNALYACDPVTENARGLFVSEEAAAAVAGTLLPRADIATPNVFELSRLASRPVETAEEARAACRALAERGPRTVVATSMPAAAGTGVLACRGGEAWLVETPILPVAGNGAGDTMTAILLGRLLGGATLADAVSHAVSATYELLEAGDGDGVALVAAQDRIAAPKRRFAARALAAERQ